MLSRVYKSLGFTFSSLKVPIVDVEPYLKGKPNTQDSCK